MERADMPPAEPPPLEHDTWGAPHPKAAFAGPPAQTAGFHSTRPVPTPAGNSPQRAPSYGADYYAAFPVDPDGYRIEAYCGV